MRAFSLANATHLPVTGDLHPLRREFTRWLSTANAVALGGRYDEVGKAFGRARPATGFSMDLRDLARTAPHEAGAAALRAPYSNDPGLATAIRKLRAAGEIVVVGLPGHAAERAQPECDRELVKRTGKWTVRKLGKS